MLSYRLKNQTSKHVEDAAFNVGRIMVYFCILLVVSQPLLYFLLFFQELLWCGCLKKRQKRTSDMHITVCHQKLLQIRAKYMTNSGKFWLLDDLLQEKGSPQWIAFTRIILYVTFRNSRIIFILMTVENIYKI